MDRRILFFSNGIFKPMPHDNFLINTAKKANLPVRPIEQHLKSGEVVRVGQFSFKMEGVKHGNHQHPVNGSPAGVPISPGGDSIPGGRWPWPDRKVPGDGGGNPGGDRGDRDNPAKVDPVVESGTLHLPHSRVAEMTVVC